MAAEGSQQGLLFVVSGPAGAGKDVVLRALRRRNKDIHFVVTATTRPRRRNEVEGRDYYFVSLEAFQQMIARGELLEYAIVHGSHYYGVPKDQVRRVLAEGRDAIMRIDVQGAATIRAIAPETVFIFLRPASLEELEQRLRLRDTENPQELERRLLDAQREMEEAPKFEYTVVNRNGHLDDAVADIAAIIRAEHCRTKRRQIVL